MSVNTKHDRTGASNERDPKSIVETAYQKAETARESFVGCLPANLSDFERALVKEAFAVGRLSVLKSNEEDAEIMRELGLT